MRYKGLPRLSARALVSGGLAIAMTVGWFAPTGNAATATTTCEKYALVPVADGAYYVQTNKWNSDAQQCLSTDGTASFSITQSEISVGTSGPPGSYPSIYRGCHWGACTANSGLPVQVSNVGHPTSSWSTTQPDGGAYNVAYDLWFNQSPSTTGQPDGAELMIWLNSRGPVQPAGSKVATVTVAGHSWDVWRTQMPGWNYVAYVHTTGVTEVSNLDLGDITRDAVSRGVVSPSWYLIAAEAGFEIWQGGAGLATTSFSFQPKGATTTTTSPSTTTTSPSTTTTTKPPTTTPTTALTATFSKSSDWGSGFVADYTIRNDGPSTVNGWRLEFDLPAGHAVTNAWNAVLTSAGGHYVLTDESWTRTIAPGASVQVGFQVAYTGTFVAPQHCLLNGQACEGGPTSPPDTTSPTAPDAPAAVVTATFNASSDWGSGYVGAYTISNHGASTVQGWRLEFDLPAGHAVTNAWNGVLTSVGNHSVLTDESWNHTIAPGASVQIGFQVAYTDTFVAPQNCLLNGQACAGTAPPPADTTAPTAPSEPTGATPAVFAPYVDLTLYPQFSLGEAARTAGIRHFTLAFIVSGGGCQAAWGGVTPIDDPWISASLADLRSAGGDAIISFGGAAGRDLASACPSSELLAAQYQAVIDHYGIRDLDFDIEGAGAADSMTIDRRFEALAQVQAAGRAAGKPVHVSLTLPVMPTGLTRNGLDVIRSAITHGVDVGHVNVMAMDYYDPSLSYVDRMGDYAIQAAQNTHAQLGSLYPQRGVERRWAMIGVTPMIGVNDDPNEVFTTADAAQLTTFAQTQGLGRLAMWSANRDAPCPTPTQWASPTCSGVPDPQWAFAEIFTAFGV